MLSGTSLTDVEGEPESMDHLIEMSVYSRMQSFANGTGCCDNWWGPYMTVKEIISSTCLKFGLNSSDCRVKGLDAIKVFKEHCRHVVHKCPNLILPAKCKEEIFEFLQEDGEDDFEYKCVMQLVDQLAPTIVLPRIKLALGCQERHTPAESLKQIEDSTWKILPYKDEIIEKINTNKILVINGDASLEKSTAIPFFVMQHLSEQRAYCKILVIENEDLLAIANCSSLVEQYITDVGKQIGYQIHLQSQVCEYTNIIYTTAEFFLRVLMGTQECLKDLTHIFISNANLHRLHSDIVLHEIRKNLLICSDLRLIILCNTNQSTNFIYYFGQGTELNLYTNSLPADVYYSEDISLMTQSCPKANVLSHIVRDSLINGLHSEDKDSEVIDNAIEIYANTGSDESFDNVLEAITAERATANYRHSKSGRTCLTLAILHNNQDHLKMLLECENANPFIQDKTKFCALDYAISLNNSCITTLLGHLDEQMHIHRPRPIDFDLLNELIQILVTSWKFGHILVFLPSYEDLLKQKHKIMKQQFVGKISQNVVVHLLWHSMTHKQLKSVINESDCRKIILATNFAEELAFMKDVTYVIDTCIETIEVYNVNSNSTTITFQLISKENAQRRQSIADRSDNGSCFRLIPREFYAKFPLVPSPELTYKCLHRICLTVKLLCPTQSPIEYFENVISKPPWNHLHQSIEFLKQIDILNELENITWLGCRVTDLPIDLQLAKSLVVSVLFKCLDPVLTLVSLSAFTDSTELRNRVKQIHERNPPITHFDFNNLESDHLTLLCHYQYWQNYLKASKVVDYLCAEDEYIVNGIFENVNENRAALLAVMRSAQLVHNQGNFSMTSINTNASNAAVIKTALAIGLYPNIGLADTTGPYLKSNHNSLAVHRMSTIRFPKTQPINSETDDNLSRWIMYSAGRNRGSLNSIVECTLISPLTVALFVGPCGSNPDNIDSSNEESLGSATKYYIDDWIAFACDNSTAFSIYKLRQLFYVAYNDYLETCGHIVKWKKFSPASKIHSSIIEFVSTLVRDVDTSLGYPQPTLVGERPRIKSSCPLPEDHVNPARNILDLDGTSPIKEFILLKEHETTNCELSLGQSIQDAICSRTAITSTSERKMLYLISYNLTRERFTGLTLVNCCGKDVEFYNYLELYIYGHDFITVCKKLKITLPDLTKQEDPVLLHGDVGAVILEMISYTS